jgi:hypothetical protein
MTEQTIRMRRHQMLRRDDLQPLSNSDIYETGRVFLEGLNRSTVLFRQDRSVSETVSSALPSLRHQSVFPNGHLADGDPSPYFTVQE